jgi:small redox-active disulfide protein 2
MKIEILGTGCPKCNMLTENAKAAAVKLGVPAEITKVTDIMQITQRGVLMTPALVVDGLIKSAGKVPTVTEIERMLTAASAPMGGEA